jgi:hypothetical protein
MNQSGGDLSRQLVEMKDTGAVNRVTNSGTELTTENEQEV